MDNIEVFNNSKIILERKTSPTISLWSTIVIISLIICFIIISFYKFHQYLYYIGTIVNENDEYYVKLYIEQDNITNIPNSNLIINKQKHKYQILSISKNYYIIEQNKKVYEVLLKVDLEKELLLDNNFIEMNFQLPRTTIMKKIITNIKKEMI